MSPRRWGVNTRVWAYRFLVLRDGERCAACGSTPTSQNEVLDIHHIDGLLFNSDPDNLLLLCRSCNTAKGNGARPALRADLAPTTQNSLPSAQRERERKEGRPETRVAKEAIDYTSGGVEMQANYLYEVQFRNWLMEKVAQKGSIEKGDAIAAGAEVVGASTTTTAKYLAKLTSSAGPLKEVKGILGEKTLILKEYLQAEMFHDSCRTRSAYQEKSAHLGVSRPSQSRMPGVEDSEPTSREASR